MEKQKTDKITSMVITYCEEKSIIRSISRKGTSTDNASVESFHSTLK